MSYKLDAKTLTSLPVFKGLSGNEMTEIAALFQLERKNNGDTICREHEAGTSVFVLLSGAAEVLRETAQGDKQRIAVVKAPSVIGELALVDGSPRSATVKLLETSDVARIEVSDFNKLRTAYNPVAYKVLRNIGIILCERLRETNDKIATFFADPEKAMSAMQKRQKDLWQQREASRK